MGLLKYGTVTEVDPKGFVRVQFDEDDIVSGPLPMLFPGTLKNKFYAMPDVNEHVACLMDSNCENGVCMGAIYSEADTAYFTNANKIGVKYDNTDVFEYDRTAQTWKTKIDTLEFNMIKTDGFEMKKGSETLKKLIVDLITKVEAIIDADMALTVGTGTGPSSVPLNIASYVTVKADIAAIKTRVNGFFKT